MNLEASWNETDTGLNLRNQLLFEVDNDLLLFWIVESIHSLHGVEHQETEHQNSDENYSDDDSHPRAWGERRLAVGSKCGEVLNGLSALFSYVLQEGRLNLKNNR